MENFLCFTQVYDLNTHKHLETLNGEGRSMNIIHLMYGPEETVNFVFPRVPMFPETKQLELLPPASSQNVTEETIHDPCWNGHASK